MRHPRAALLLALLALAVFLAAFALGRAFRDPGAGPPAPPPVVESGVPDLVELGPPARLTGPQR